MTKTIKVFVLDNMDKFAEILEDPYLSANSYSCIPEELFIDEIYYKDHFTCVICFQILRDPITELMNNHTFGRKCLEKILKNTNKCPICQSNLNKEKDIVVNRFAKNIIDELMVKCFYYKECPWTGKCESLYHHLKFCKSNAGVKDKIFKKVVDKMKGVLEIEINQHLKINHLMIYNDHVKGWEWLLTDSRDWKWWWWCNNPWWENIPCITCNYLWHKYQNVIDRYDYLRRDILLK